MSIGFAAWWHIVFMAVMLAKPAGSSCPPSVCVVVVGPQQFPLHVSIQYAGNVCIGVHADALPWPGKVCEHGHVQYACERHSNGNLPGTVYGSLFVEAA
jgi:hypothetical protein